jgi:uncharacterized protein (TIGR02147 family)
LDTHPQFGFQKAAVYRMSTLVFALKDPRILGMKPAVKKYLNCYQYLQDAYQARKSQSADFSYDVWAKELGASTKSYVRMMVLGKRPINEKMTQMFALTLGLDAVDKEYFIDLVHYTQSKSHEQKKLFGRKLISGLKDNFEQQQVLAHFDFLSNPLLPKLQVALSFTDLDQAPDKLALLLSAEEAEIIAGLKKLEEIKLIEKIGDKYRPIKSSFKISDNFGDIGLETFYSRSLEDAQKAISLPKEEERRFKTLLLPLNEGEFNSFIDNMNSFSREQLTFFDKDELTGRRIYQVHLNIIPVSANPLEA